MASLLFPDAGSRKAEDGSNRAAAHRTAVVYADAAGTTPAEIYADDDGTRGALLVNSTLTTDSYGFLPLFWGPDSGADKLWISVNGGPVWPVDAENNDRIDALTARVAAVEATGGGGGDGPGLAAHVAATTSVHGIAATAELETQAGAQARIGLHNADTVDVHGIADTALLETGEGAQGRVDTHNSQTVSVHGITNTALLETQTGAQAKADTAQASAVASSAQRAANLSDLASAATARTNLGLGGAAVLNVGETVGTVAAGNDGRFADARTPTAHAGSHAAAGSDPVTVTQAQVAGLTTTLGNKADLVGGVVPSSQLPDILIGAVYPAADETEMLALNASQGDIAIRSDFDPAQAYILAGTDPTVLGNWTQINLAGAVLTVNGQSGSVTLSAADVAAAPTSRTITAGSYLTGGGDLTTDRTIAANVGTTAGTLAAGDDSRITSAVQPSRQIATTAPLAGGGTLSADRTLTVANATTTTTGVIQLAGDLAGTGTTPTVAAGAITSAKIADGTIVDGDISASAAVAQSKISGLTAALAASAQKSANLSDLASASTARTNLGLGTAAVLGVGTTAGTVAAGDDTRLSDARTPTAHAASHAAGGLDPIAVAQSQVTGLTGALAAKADLSSTQTALDNKVVKGALVVDVRDYGAAVNGVTDDTTALQNAVAAAAGGHLLLPAGTMKVTATVTVPSNTTIYGIGAGAVIQVPAASTFRVFDIDGKTGVTIRDLKLTKASGAALSGTAYGISIRGASTDIVIERVHADGYVRGIQIAGGEGTTPGTCARITLRSCTGANSPSNFGINIDDADGVTLDGCYGRGNWLDGLKLRRNTRNVTVVGGTYAGNGASGAGDGADCYAGGDTFTMLGVEFSGNTGNGLTVKTGDLNQTDPTGYGYVRNVDLIGLRCVGNAGVGAYITVSNQGDLTEPVVSSVTVTGGYFAENTTSNGDGLYINARNVTVNGVKCRRNQRNGITIGTRAFDVTLVSVISLANGSGAGTGTGVSIGGKRVKMLGGTVLGVDADTVAVEGDYAALTKYHLRNVDVTTTAADVELHWVEAAYNSSGIGVRTDLTSGVCIINQRGTGVPNSAGAYGSLGSTFIRTDASGTDVQYVKTSGAPNAPTTGWNRTLFGATVSGALDFGSVAAAASSTLTVSTGASSSVTTSDVVVATPPSNLNAGLAIRSWVSAANTVSVQVTNVTGSAIDPPSGTWRIAVLKG